MHRLAAAVIVVAVGVGCGRLAFGSRALDGGGGRDVQVSDRPADVPDGPSGDGDADGDAVGDDAGAAPPPTRPLGPANGLATGSPHAGGGAPAAARALRPLFRWLAVASANHYELEADDSCSVDGFAACPFPSPELRASTPEVALRPDESLPVSLTPPVGRRYFWRVRACSAGGACSAWTDVRYVDVGRMRSDYDGDGYADVAVGAPYQEAPELNEGNVFVHGGGPAGVGPVPSLTLDNPADQPSGGFGWSVATAGDVNADGYADLVVGAPFQDAPESTEGNVFLYLGGPTGLPSAPSVTLDNPTDQVGALFGRAVAGAGDVNADGYADLVVGAPLYDAPEHQEGNAFVYHGGPDGVPEAPSVTLDSPGDQVGARFGYAVAGAGDVSGDGIDDLAAGAPLLASSVSAEGAVYVFLGSLAGIDATPGIALGSPKGDVEGGYLGASLSPAGDVNGDGYGDLLVGAPDESAPETAEGNAYLFYGGAEGVDESRALALDNPDDDDLGEFGIAVAGGADVNGDGYTDLVVGAHGQSTSGANEGAAFVFHGAAAGLEATPSSALDNPAGQAAGRFGAAVAF